MGSVSLSCEMAQTNLIFALLLFTKGYLYSIKARSSVAKPFTISFGISETDLIQIERDIGLSLENYFPIQYSLVIFSWQVQLIKYVVTGFLNFQCSKISSF